MCSDGIREVVDDPSLLQAQRLHHGQHPLREPTARFAMTAKRAPPPQHRRAQCPLGCVIRRFHSVGTHECPQCRLQLQQVGAERGRLGAAQRRPAVQQVPQPGALALDIAAQTRPLQRPVTDAIPPMEHVLGKTQQLLTQRPDPAAALHERRKVADQMRPAQLAAVQLQPVVPTPAVARHNTLDRIAQQRRQGGGPATGMNQEEGHATGDRRPQPATPACLFPTGFVGVLAGGLLYGCGGLGMGRGQCGTDFLLHGTDGAQRPRHAEDRLDHLANTAFAIVAGTTEVSHHRGQAWPDAMRAHAGRDGSVVQRAATRAVPRMALVLGDASGDRRQFGDLVPGRLRVVRPGLLRQGAVATPAVRRQVANDLMNLLGRQADGRGGRMAGLSARFAAGGLLDDGLGRIGRVGRGRQRGIAGVLSQAGLQVAHERLQFGDTPLQLATTGTAPLGHASSLQAARLRSCARFRLNGYDTLCWGCFYCRSFSQRPNID